MGVHFRVFFSKLVVLVVKYLIFFKMTSSNHLWSTKVNSFAHYELNIRGQSEISSRFTALTGPAGHRAVVNRTDEPLFALSGSSEHPTLTPRNPIKKRRNSGVIPNATQANIRSNALPHSSHWTTPPSSTPKQAQTDYTPARTGGESDMWLWEMQWETLAGRQVLSRADNAPEPAQRGSGDRKAEKSSATQKWRQTENRFFGDNREDNEWTTHESSRPTQKLPEHVKGPHKNLFVAELWT